MKVLLGKKGLENSWQAPFKKTIKCNACKKGKGRIMFVAFEEAGDTEFVSGIRKNGGEGDFWVHDAVAIALYLCKDCFKVSAVLNQA